MAKDKLLIDNTFTPVEPDPQYILQVNALGRGEDKGIYLRVRKQQSGSCYADTGILCGTGTGDVGGLSGDQRI